MSRIETCYPTSTNKGYENLKTFKSALNKASLIAKLHGDYLPDGALAMFPKLVHNPSFLGMTEEQLVKALSGLGLWVLEAKGTNITVDAQTIRNELGFDTGNPNTRVHVPKTTAENDIVIFAFTKKPSREELLSFIKTQFKMTDFK